MITLTYTLTYACNHCELEARVVSESEPMLDFARRHPPSGWSWNPPVQGNADGHHFCPVCTERGKGES